MKNIVFHIVTSSLFCTPLQGQDKLYPNTFPSADVVLLDGPFKKARDLNLTVLLAYDVDRLLQPYLKEAGLPEKGAPFPNWAGLDGHVGGHYLSALALYTAATGDAECRRRMRYMLSELKKCQEAHATKFSGWGEGYLGGMPGSGQVWPAFMQGDLAPYRSAWVPWYNLHKMYAGLRDAWLYTGDSTAKELFLKFCDWGIRITSGLTEVQMQSMLDTEHGGMNEIFADAYQLTGDKKYLLAAKRFSHQQLLDPMSAGVDNLDNKHANTQVPKAIGFLRIGELGKEDSYTKAGRFFWETVTLNRSLAFGGNSRREFFPSVSSCIDFINDVEGPESCNSYNMLRLTEGLFRENPKVAYADYYERTVYNHILSTQHPGHGGYVYFTPVRPRHYRVYSKPNEAMWCCVGSGMENHGKYNQFIYTRDKDALYLNLFTASTLDWKEKKVRIRQETGFPYEERTRMTITEGQSAFAVKTRYPSWVRPGALKILVNKKMYPFTAGPGEFITLKRKWKKGDVVEIELPMHLSVEPMPGVPEYIAFRYGPVVLGAETGTEDLAGLAAGENRWGHIAGGKRLPVDQSPVLVVDTVPALTRYVQPVKGLPLHFSFSGVRMINPADLVLKPFYTIHDTRYMLYWMALTPGQYTAYLDSLSGIEKKKLAIHGRTIDHIQVGEQQPEADHLVKHENSHTGHQPDAAWRDARNGGFFSYVLSTGNEKKLSLLIRYWGAEWGNRKFDIYIDDEKWLTEDNTGRWNQSAFKDIEYAIPEKLVQNKKEFRLVFRALPGNTAGAVYDIRLLRQP